MWEIEAATVRRLAEKYAGAGPRYTSYPTAVEFHTEVTSSVWGSIFPGEIGVGPISLYFHLPFCPSLCYFCACNKVITIDRGVVRPYLEAVFRELRTYRSLLGNADLPVEQLHWGGGSPNFLSPSEMCELQRETREHFPSILPGADISVELDPRTTTLEQLEALRAAGFCRISLGVQDFDRAVQEAVNRRQSYEMTAALVQRARELGFSGINVDLIYGLPRQTRAGFRETVDRIRELRPDRIALYGYAHVTWLHKVQKSFHRLPLPTPGERLEIFLDALGGFRDSGYEYIGLDHFALPSDPLAVALGSGTLNRNFMGYTTHRGVGVLGFGVSAISTVDAGFAQNAKEVGEYQRRVKEEGMAVARGFLRSAEDRLRGAVIDTILCRHRVDFTQLTELYGVAAAQLLAEARPVLSQFSADGLIAEGQTGFSLTFAGRLFARNIAMTFDAYLGRHRERQVFSQAV